jgi:hypothetical protein
MVEPTLLPLTAVNVRVTVTLEVKVPELLLVKEPIGAERAVVPSGSSAACTMDPDTPKPPEAKPAPVTVRLAVSGRFWPLFGLRSMVRPGCSP